MLGKRSESLQIGEEDGQLPHLSAERRLAVLRVQLAHQIERRVLAHAAQRGLRLLQTREHGVDVAKRRLHRRSREIEHAHPRCATADASQAASQREEPEAAAEQDQPDDHRTRHQEPHPDGTQLARIGRLGDHDADEPVLRSRQGAESRQPAFSVYLQLAGALDTLLLVEQRAAQREGNGRRQPLRGDTQVVADQGQAILRRQARDQPSVRVGDEDPVWIVLADLQRRNGIDGRRQKSGPHHAD